MTAPAPPDRSEDPRPPPRGRVLVAGASGDIGRATVQALVDLGYDVVAVMRPRGVTPATPAGVNVRFAEVCDPVSLARDGFAGERFDAVISCLASRTGAPADAWAVDHQANLNLLDAARDAGVGHFVLVSALCVQKPRLAFQHAKLAFEAALIASRLRYSIVRPTAFFKSLSGQIGRVRRGRPFLVFGDGALTACKPIGDADLARYVADCLRDEARWNRTLPIGGPGPAITPREQGEALFALLGRPARFKHVPVGVMDAVIAVLSRLGRLIPALADKAEFARTGRYYATESMLVLDPETGRYDPDATPSTGTRTLFDFYAGVIAGDERVSLGEHAVFDRAAARPARRPT